MSLKKKPPKRLIGYARVSTQQQDLARQLKALKRAGCLRIYSDTASGKTIAGRPELVAALDALDRGDELLCCTDVPNFPWRNERDRRRAISARGFIVPFKHHSEGRRHIPRQRHRVTNWRDYDEALRNRGSLIVWFT